MYNYFKINKRKKIFQGLREMREKTPENIVIEYFEKSYVNDYNDSFRIGSILTSE